MRYSSIEVHVPSVLGAGVDHQVARFVHRRQSFQFFWNANQLYSILQRECYQGVPSKWTHYARKQWISWCNSAGLRGAEHVQQSCSSTTKGGLPPSLACPAVSTPTLLRCLATMGFANTQQGGLRDGKGQELAKKCVEHVLLGSLRGRTWQLQFRVLDDWEAAWPLSEPHSADLIMSCGSNGLVDLTPWQTLVDQGGHLVLVWWNALVAGHCSAVSGKMCIPLLQLFARASTSNYVSFFRQLLWQLGRQIENVLILCLSNKGVDDSMAINCKVPSLRDMFDNDKVLDHNLLRYVESRRDALADCRHLNMSHDKGNVSGLPLQLSAVFCGNTGVVMLPMVAGPVVVYCAFFMFCSMPHRGIRS